MFKSFFSSHLQKNVLKLLTANVLTQFIALAVYPIVSRLYSPEEFGVFNIFMSICGVFFILSTGRYEVAIQLPKSNKDAAALFRLCIQIALILSLLLTLAILFFGKNILNIFSIKSFGNGIWLLPLIVFFNAISISLVSWMNRNKKFGLTSKYLIVQSSSNSFLKIFFGWLQHTRLGLVFAYLISYLIGFFAVLFSRKNKRIFAFLLQRDKIRTTKVAQQYKNFPYFNMPHAFVNMLSSNLPVLLLAPFFGEKIIGFFAMTLTLGFRPINVLNSSFNNVFFQRMSELKNANQSIIHIFRKFCFRGFLILIPVFILIYIFSDAMVPFLLGKEWTETVKSLKLMLPSFFVTIFGGAFSFIPFLFFKQKNAMLIEVCYAVARIIALLFGVYTHSFYNAIAVYSAVSVIFIMFQLLWYYKMMVNYEREIIQ